MAVVLPVPGSPYQSSSRPPCSGGSGERRASRASARPDLARVVRRRSPSQVGVSTHRRCRLGEPPLPTVHIVSRALPSVGWGGGTGRRTSAITSSASSAVVAVTITCTSGRRLSEHEVQRPAVAHEEALAVAVVLHELPGQVRLPGREPVDAVHLGEEGLAGVGLLALQEAEGGEIDQAGRQTAIAQRPDGLGHLQPLRHRRDGTHRLHPAIGAANPADRRPLADQRRRQHAPGPLRTVPVMSDLPTNTSDARAKPSPSWATAPWSCGAAGIRSA